MAWLALTVREAAVYDSFASALHGVGLRAEERSRAPLAPQFYEDAEEGDDAQSLMLHVTAAGAF